MTPDTFIFIVICYLILLYILYSLVLETANIAGNSFRNMINIGISERGLYISAIFPVNLSHRPILIPWNAINKIENGNNILYSK